MVKLPYERSFIVKVDGILSPLMPLTYHTLTNTVCDTSRIRKSLFTFAAEFPQRY